MKNLGTYTFWFLAGSQHLYGPEVLEKVRCHAKEMVQGMQDGLPCSIVYKNTVTTPDEITNIIKQANADENCAGVITWMHTFSPSKMWINGLQLLQKPYLHFHTQYNRRIPNEEIDMDFMNLNQSAHGDREHGFISARMRIPHKIVVGYWKDAKTKQEIGAWMRSAVGVCVSKNLKLVRFGDNMRQVAVTEGDKVQAQIQLGWQVNTWAVGDLVQVIETVSDEEIDEQMRVYRTKYEFATDDIETVRYQAREEIAIRKILDEQGAGAFSNTFEDLYGMKQLPGLASQDLMHEGYGYGGEGDWKVSAMTHIVKCMAQGLDGGTAFMEDYTYDLQEGCELSLGAHMLEVCPSIAAQKPKIKVAPLGIGGKEPPARLVFEGAPGDAILISLVDIGGRFRLIVHDIECVKPQLSMPNLPVARIMWKAMPDFVTGTKAWITAGGAHHAVLTQALRAQHMEDWAEMMGIEYVHIQKSTTLEAIKQHLFLSDLAWKLR